MTPAPPPAPPPSAPPPPPGVKTSDESLWQSQMTIPHSLRRSSNCVFMCRSSNCVFMCMQAWTLAHVYNQLVIWQGKTSPVWLNLSFFSCASTSLDISHQDSFKSQCEMPNDIAPNITEMHKPTHHVKVLSMGGPPCEAKVDPNDRWYRIHSKRCSCSGKRSPAFIIKLLAHKNRRNRWFLYQKCMDLRSDFELMILHQRHVFLTLNALLLEWIR